MQEQAEQQSSLAANSKSMSPMGKSQRDSPSSPSQEEISVQQEQRSEEGIQEEPKGKEEEQKVNQAHGPTRNPIHSMNHPMGLPIHMGMIQPPPPHQDPKFMMPMPNMYPGMYPPHQPMMRSPHFMNPFGMSSPVFPPMNPMGMGMGMGMMPMPPNPMMGGMMPYPHMQAPMRPMNMPGMERILVFC